jgi:hypothetical protein
MACISPLKGWCAPDGGIVFAKKHSHTKIPMEVPCGQCWSCRLARSREWATRLVKEAMYWPEEKRSFITLTYAPEHLPHNQSVDVKEFQKFMKRLRKHFGHPKLKYFHCGEYGKECRTCGKSKPVCERQQEHEFKPQLGRPHYHSILYGIQWNDLEEFKRTKAGELIYKSETLNKLWGKGFCSIGNLTFESCAYVARYVMKKVNGDMAKEHYKKEVDICPNTGQINNIDLTPEYITMSRNPAIAKEYFSDYQDEIIATDSLLLNRKGQTYPVRPPRYFSKIIEKSNPNALAHIKTERLRKRQQQKDEFTEARADVKQTIKKLKMSEITRDFEEFHE